MHNTQSNFNFNYQERSTLGATEQMVTACPEITIVKTVDDIDFLVLATDGIWDRMTNQQARHNYSVKFLKYIYIYIHKYK